MDKPPFFDPFDVIRARRDPLLRKFIWANSKKYMVLAFAIIGGCVTLAEFLPEFKPFWNWVVSWPLGIKAYLALGGYLQALLTDLFWRFPMEWQTKKNASTALNQPQRPIKITYSVEQKPVDGHQ